MTQRYLSHGKILLTGEYLVLHGALALALPLKLGQSMEVETLPSCDNRLNWEAFQPQGHWFSATIDKNNLQTIATDDAPKARKLCEVLNALKGLNPALFHGHDLHFSTRLGFHPEWGLGSSSTLIANLAQWAKANPYTLLQMTFGGSGYDIACATATHPLFYQLVEGQPQIAPAPFAPAFSDNLHFIYQGKKQNSAKEVGAFKERMSHTDLRKEIDAVTSISRALPDSRDLQDFRSMLNAHETILSRCLDREPLQTQFPDFEGSLKSLGAWGGDFFLAATEWDETRIKNYFKTNGLDIVLEYKDIVQTL